MTKNEPLGVAARDADEQSVRASAAQTPFRIVSLRRVSFGSKRAEFTIETPLGLVDADLFEPEGRLAFVAGRSIRCKYSGKWKRTVALDRAFAARVLAALRAQDPNAEAKRIEPKPQRIEPSKTLLESERRFDAAFGGVDDGGAL